MYNNTFVMEKEINSEYTLSVIVPLYNEENIIGELYNRINKSLSNIKDYEIIQLIEDYWVDFFPEKLDI